VGEGAQAWRGFSRASRAGSGLGVSGGVPYDGLVVGRLRTAGVIVGLAAVTSAAALSGCAVRRVHAIDVPGPGDRPVALIEAIGSDRQALVSIKAVFERDFGLPAFPVQVLFYPDGAAFEAALRSSGYDAAFAARSARTLTAIGGYRRVLLNEREMPELRSLERLALLAHELVHCVQYELGGGRRGSSEQWLREGFAEWVSLSTLERLQGPSFSAVRREMRERFGASDRRAAPRLREMATFPQWVALAGRTDLAMMEQAFLAVDLLIAERGLPAVVDYFRRFGTLQDPLVNFEAAFGEPLATFEERLDQALGLRR
jgi:hypothetical protein